MGKTLHYLSVAWGFFVPVNILYCEGVAKSPDVRVISAIVPPGCVVRRLVANKVWHNEYWVGKMYGYQSGIDCGNYYRGRCY